MKAGCFEKTRLPGREKIDLKTQRLLVSKRGARVGESPRTPPPRRGAGSSLGLTFVGEGFSEDKRPCGRGAQALRGSSGDNSIL